MTTILKKTVPIFLLSLLLFFSIKTNFFFKPLLCCCLFIYVLSKSETHMTSATSNRTSSKSILVVAIILVIIHIIVQFVDKLIYPIESLLIYTGVYSICQVALWLLGVLSISKFVFNNMKFSCDLGKLFKLLMLLVATIVLEVILIELIGSIYSDLLETNLFEYITGGYGVDYYAYVGNILYFVRFYLITIAYVNYLEKKVE